MTPAERLNELIAAADGTDGFCSQCGKMYSDEACGFSHAEMAMERARAVDHFYDMATPAVVIALCRVALAADTLNIKEGSADSHVWDSLDAAQAALAAALEAK